MLQRITVQCKPDVMSRLHGNKMSRRLYGDLIGIASVSTVIYTTVRQSLLSYFQKVTTSSKAWIARPGCQYAVLTRFRAHLVEENICWFLQHFVQGYSRDILIIKFEPLSTGLLNYMRYVVAAVWCCAQMCDYWYQIVHDILLLLWAFSCQPVWVDPANHIAWRWLIIFWLHSIWKFSQSLEHHIMCLHKVSAVRGQVNTMCHICRNCQRVKLCSASALIFWWCWMHAHCISCRIGVPKWQWSVTGTI